MHTWSSRNRLWNINCLKVTYQMEVFRQLMYLEYTTFRRVFASTVAKNVPIVSYSACEDNHFALCMVESLSCSASSMPMKST